jgi:hypothetical protein
MQTSRGHLPDKFALFICHTEALDIQGLLVFLVVMAAEEEGALPEVCLVRRLGSAGVASVCALKSHGTTPR